MSDTLGRIVIPDFPTTGLSFPLVSDLGFAITRSFPIIEHRFGELALKSSQRFLVGIGPRKFGFQRQRLSNSNRTALLNFWEACQGSVKSFAYAAPELNGTTTNYTVIFEQQPLSFTELVHATQTGFSFLEVNDAKTATTFAVMATNLRFPSSALQSALLSQVQQLIPLVHIRVRDRAVPDMYLSDRRCIVGTQLYLPRLLGVGEPGSDVLVSQNISGQADNVQFAFGNADRVMTQLSNDCDLQNASIDLCFYHVGSQTVLQLWKGIVISFQSDGSPQFTVQCSDGLYQVNRLYPNKNIGRTCWKLFNDGVNCPYSTQGSGGNPTLCSYQFDSTYVPGDPAQPGGCAQHGMTKFFGGQSVSPQGVNVKDNSTGVAGFGRNTVTATSIVSDTIWGQTLPEIWCNDGGDLNKAFVANALIADVRDEGDYIDVLGIVGAGPIGQFSVGGAQGGLFVTNADGFTHLVAPLADGFPCQGLRIATTNGTTLKANSNGLGLRQVAGNDPVNPANDSFSLGQLATATSSTWGPEMAAGTAFVELRYSKPSGFMPSTTDSHNMTVPISQGLCGWTWDAGGIRSQVGGMTNPFWIAVNSYLRALGLSRGIPVPPVFTTITVTLPPSSLWGFLGSISGTLKTALFVVSPYLAMISAISSAFTGNAFSVPMTNAANQAETVLQANLSFWWSISPTYKTSANKAICLANFDTIWTAYVQACTAIFQGDPNGSDAKKALNRSIGDRNHGGKYDWYVLYRNPISNDSTPGDSLPSTTVESNNQLSYFVNPFVGDGTGPAEIADLSVAAILGTGVETQFQFQGTLAQQKPFRDWLTELMSCCLGYFTFEFGKLKLGIRENASAVEAFTVGNTLYQSLKLSPIDPQFEKLTIDYADAQYQYQANTGEYSDKSHAQYYGRTDSPLSARLHSAGISTLSQALRVAATRVREELGGVNAAEWLAARKATWQTTILALNTEVGQVVSLTHPDIPGGVGNFRIQSWKLKKDWSIEIEAQTVTVSMYDLDMGPKPVDQQPDRLPILIYPQPVGPAWAPYQIQAGSADALYPNEWTFDLAPAYALDASGGGVANLVISGKLPVNQFLPNVSGPNITAGNISVSTTGGNLPGGMLYRVSVCAANATNQQTPPSQIILVQTPPGTNTNAFTLQGVEWPKVAGLTQYFVFVSDDDQLICEQQTGAITGAPASYGPASITVAGPLARLTWALPNAKVNMVRPKGKLLIHGGVIGCAVDTVAANTIVASEAVDATPGDPQAGTDNWAGRALAIIGRLGGASAPYWSANITGFAPSTGTFTLDRDPTGVVLPGDAFVVCFAGYDNSVNNYEFHDAGMSNAQDLDSSGNPSPHAGLRPHSEIGVLLRVIKGTGRGQYAKVVDNDATGYTLDGPLTLDGSSVVIVEAPAWETQVESSAIPNSDFNVATSLTLPITNYARKSMLIGGFTVDDRGVESVESDVLVRMVYIYGFGLTRNTAVSTTQLLTDSRILCDTTAGAIIVTLLPQALCPNVLLLVEKISADANAVTVRCDGVETFDNGTATYALQQLGDSMLLKL